MKKTITTLQYVSLVPKPKKAFNVVSVLWTIAVIGSIILIIINL